jgi:hypothetical protein
MSPVLLQQAEGEANMPNPTPPTAPIIESAKSFRGFETAFKDAALQGQRVLKQQLAASRSAEIKTMLNAPLTDEAWLALLAKAQITAKHGAKQFQLLTFPSGLCTDGARAINNPPNPDWPSTLRGEALAMYERWKATLEPLGFRISAEVIDFPGGQPGDVALSLLWGE